MDYPVRCFIFSLVFILIVILNSFAADNEENKTFENVNSLEELNKETIKRLQRIDKTNLPTENKETEKEKLLKERDELKSHLDMFGFNFGFGLMGSYYFGDKRVDTASVVNNKVQIEKGDNKTLGVVFETHNTLWTLQKNKVYLGPFLGIQTTTVELLDSAILGIMIAFKYKNDEKGSFNIGLGFVYDPSVKVLADDFKVGEPIPTGESSIRTKEITQMGIGIIVSYGF
jgi:hypothetical protein